MKPSLLLLFAGTILLSSCAGTKLLNRQISFAEQQAALMIKESNLATQKDARLVSPRTLENGELKMVASRDWTSGFFPGELWYLYQLSNKSVWRDEAQKFTALIEQEKLNATTHDMGFKIYCSFGTGYNLTKNPVYKEVIIKAAQTLSTRFNPTIGAIRSWDHHQEQWKFPVIIDNMLNLELLFAATRLSGDSSFYKIAVSHANTTMKNHFRNDYSTWHVLDYDPATGAVKQKQTHQGYSDASSWARGQAWALYGYTMCYRETRNPKYLKQAEAIESFLFTHPNMPSDLVPYWDFNAPGISNEPKDVSAATVIASALYELASYSSKAKKYRTTADKIMNSLVQNHLSQPDANKGFLLLNSTGSKPANSEVDVPLIYADYYYLEALLRRAGKQL